MHTKCLENFSPPILLSAVVIGLMGGEACVLTSVMRRGKKTSGKCFYSFSLSFKDTEHLLYARLLLKSMEKNGEQADVPTLKQPHSWELCGMLLQNKYTSSNRATVRALGNQIPIDAKSHDWVDVNCSPHEN